MASRNKKTTMAKLARESKLRERRLGKQARKDARKQASAGHDPSAPSPEPRSASGETPGEPRFGE